MDTRHMLRIMDTVTKSAQLSVTRLIEEIVEDRRDDGLTQLGDLLLRVAGSLPDAFFSGIAAGVSLGALSLFGVRPNPGVVVGSAFTGNLLISTLACWIFGEKSLAINITDSQLLTTSTKRYPALHTPIAGMAYGNRLAIGTGLGYSLLLLLSQSVMPLDVIFPSFPTAVTSAAAFPWTIGLLAALWIGITAPAQTNEQVHQARPAYR
jgi:hypothetical protein